MIFTRVQYTSNTHVSYIIIFLKPAEVLIILLYFSWFYICIYKTVYCGLGIYFFNLLARSPIFSHLSVSLQGLSTIRAFKVQQRFQHMFDEYQDRHSGERKHLKGQEFNIHKFFWFRPHVNLSDCSPCGFLTEAWFLFLTTSRWFAVRLDGICSVFVTIAAFGCLYFRDGSVWVLRVGHYWRSLDESLEYVTLACACIFFCYHRAAARCSGSDSVLCCYTHRHVPVGCQTECRDREHGENTCI